MKIKEIVALALMSALWVLPLWADNHKETVIPIVGNTYINAPAGQNNPDGAAKGHRGRHDRNHGAFIDNKSGLWLKDATDMCATSYIYVRKGEQPDIWLDARGKGQLQITVGKKSKKFNVSNVEGSKADGNGGNTEKEGRLLHFGKVKTKADGYLRIELQSVGSDNDICVENIVMKNMEEAPIFLKREYNTYFGLRGPSCHLNYSPSYKGEAEWAILSVKVPKEFDKEGSYYMALGFNGGYFGMQNNGRGRRQVLFSVWNAGEENDDPDAVHKAQQTIVVSKGEGVTAQNFGGEGSGKQSFRQVNWVADSTYTFLLNARKVKEGYTDFSAWFYDSVNRQWLYMSTLRRPNTNTLLKGLHSFLENFDPRQGDKTRKAYYFNGWVKPQNADWQPITKAYLTNDDTGNRGQRLDFSGAAEGGCFYLMNGGYFNRPWEIDRHLQINGHGMQKPQIRLQDFTVSGQ